VRDRIVLVRELAAVENELAQEWRPNQIASLSARALHLRAELSALESEGRHA
jgi:hypothetical protein